MPSSLVFALDDEVLNAATVTVRIHMANKLSMFERHKVYKRKFISVQLGGGTQDYLPHSGHQITYGAFSRELNPQAPSIVLPGSGPEIERWARVLAEQDDPIPVFVKKRSNEWTYMGMYRCVELSEDEEVIAEHTGKTGRPDISMVLKLARVRDAEQKPATS